MTSPRTFSAAAIVLAVLAACGDARDLPSEPTAFATGTVCPPAGTTLRHADLDLAFFGDAAGTTGYCNYCHHSTKVGAARNGAPPLAAWDDLTTIRARARDIDRMAGRGPTPTTPAMPFLLAPDAQGQLPPGVPNPQPIPSDPERENLSLWLACGAP
jgi:hypothetical protein